MTDIDLAPFISPARSRARRRADARQRNGSCRSRDTASRQGALRARWHRRHRCTCFSPSPAMRAAAAGAQSLFHRHHYERHARAEDAHEVLNWNSFRSLVGGLLTATSPVACEMPDSRSEIYSMPRSFDHRCAGLDDARAAILRHDTRMAARGATLAVCRAPRSPPCHAYACAMRACARAHAAFSPLVARYMRSLPLGRPHDRILLVDARAMR